MVLSQGNQQLLKERKPALLGIIYALSTSRIWNRVEGFLRWMKGLHVENWYTESWSENLNNRSLNFGEKTLHPFIFTWRNVAYNKLD